MRALPLSIMFLTFTAPLMAPPCAVADPFLAFQKQSLDRDPNERVKAIRTLAEYRSCESVRALLSLLGDAHPRVRKEAVKAVSGVSDPAAVECLAKAVEHGPNELVRAGAAEAIGRSHAGGARDALLVALRDGSPAVRVSAIGALQSLGDAGAAEAVAARLKDGSPLVRAAAVETLADLQKEGAVDRLLPCLTDPDVAVRIAAVERVPRLASGRAADVLTRALADPAWPVRVAAIETIESLRRADMIPLLFNRIDAEKGRLRGDLARALHALTGSEIGLDAKNWRSWWDLHGKDFTCPDPSKVRPESVRPQTAAMFCNVPIYSKRVAFVLDLSGSMRDAADGKDDDSASPRKVDVVKAELLKTIRAFGSDARFNVILLGSDGSGCFNPKDRMWTGHLAPATPEAKAQAARFVGRQLAHGYTNLYDAVAQAFQDPEVDTIILLSDGGASRGTFVVRQDIAEELLDLNRYRKIAIDTVQSGARREGDKWLMTELAARTGGVTVSR